MSLIRVIRTPFAHDGICGVCIAPWARSEFFSTAIAGLQLTTPPRRVLELGAGDGSLMLRLAQAMNPPWRRVSLTLLDRHDLVSAQTRKAYQALGWQLTVLRADALEWAISNDPSRSIFASRRFASTISMQNRSRA